MDDFTTSGTNLLNELMQAAVVPLDLTESLSRNEAGDAELFASLFSGKVAYDHSQRSWYLWRGGFWVKDQTGEVMSVISRTLAAKYEDQGITEGRNGNIDRAEKFQKRASQLRSIRRATNVLAFASSHPEIALTGKEWETPSFLLPVANGIIELRTGEFRDAQPCDYVRDYLPVEWHGINVPCPVWEATLMNIFGEDASLVAFFQRWMGYCLTGETKEQKLLMLWGSGSNGKSIVQDTVEAVLGDCFCYKTQSSSLMDFRNANGEGARPFLLGLRGKRLTIASESKEGQMLDTALIKQLTGDQRITARGLYKDPETFQLTSKIMIVTNHSLPITDAEDYAMWRRVLRLPFNIRFVDEPKLPNERKEDKHLRAKLISEYPGILAWLVRGCLEWQAQGLNPPQSVIDSTESYRIEEDLVSQYVTERLVIADHYKVQSTALYKDYMQWCENNGHHPLRQNPFAKRIAKRFSEAKHENRGNFYHGVGIWSSQ
jgi:putative DNA primase/helicase